MPEAWERGARYNFVVAHVIDGPEFANKEGYRKIFGYRLPPFQRAEVWTTAQKTRFMESLWLGLDVGTYTYNTTRRASKFDGLLIDGQQRMAALRDYLHNEFPVFGYHASEITEVDRRVLGTHTWSAYVTQYTSEQELRDYYNRMNFGGTPHNEEDRA